MYFFVSVLVFILVAVLNRYSDKQNDKCFDEYLADASIDAKNRLCINKEIEDFWQKHPWRRRINNLFSKWLYIAIILAIFFSA